MGQSAHDPMAFPDFEARESPDMYRPLRASGSLLSRYLNRQTLGAYPHPAADLALMSQILKPADVVLVEGKRRISTAIKYLTQSSWSHAAIYVGNGGGVDAEGRVRAFVEADLERGVRAFPIEELEGLHLRICRPEGLTPQDARQVVNHVLGRLGDEYDLKNVFDLARYLLPTPPVPTSWRRRMLALGSSDPTRAICSTLIAEAFETVGFPILPMVGSKAAAAPGCPDRVREVQHIRHYRLFVPRDFDVSPYFTIIKPSLCRDYRSLAWVEANQPIGKRQAPARSSITTVGAKDAARDCRANVIETNIFAAEVLKHQFPEAQRGLGRTYTNTEAVAMLRIPIGAVMTASHGALKLGDLK